MSSTLVLLYVLILLILGTVVFFLFPRTLGSLGIIGLFLLESDLGAKLRIFSIYGGSGEIEYMGIWLVAVTWIFFLWFVIGFQLDVGQYKLRWMAFLRKLK